MRNSVILGVVIFGTVTEAALTAWKRKKKRKRCARKVHEEGRKIVVVSTAAIPWMTGTAVNPLLRAAYLAELSNNEVTLVVPWLAQADQIRVFPNNLVFKEPSEQEGCMREWITHRTGLNPSFKVEWYSGRYDKVLLGIVPVGNLVEWVNRIHKDVAILEEPEHLNWYHSGLQWTEGFSHVVGVMHTNQVELGRRNAGVFGPLMASATYVLTYLLCGMHCHKVIKLSDTLQTLPRQVTCFVHGAAPRFLEEGRRKGLQPPESRSPFRKGAYALGKVVWGKGWEELLRLMEYCKKTDNLCPTTLIDCYGDGEARKTIEGKAVKRGLPLRFHDKCDHLDSKLHDYKVFVNASTSDVVATTSIEALAMGKWLVCADHPCNAFAAGFPNTLVYHTSAEFCQHLQYALDNDPVPMDDETLRLLGWEAATERFLAAAEIGPREWPSLPIEIGESMLWGVYKTFTGMEAVRLVAGAGANTKVTPQRVTDYDPAEADISARGSRLWWLVSKLRPTTFSFSAHGIIVGTDSSDSLHMHLVREQQILGQ